MYIYIYTHIINVMSNINVDSIIVTPGMAHLRFLVGKPPECGRFPKFHRVFLGRDPGTLKSDIVSKKHPQLICSDLKLSNFKFED